MLREMEPNKSVQGWNPSWYLDRGNVQAEDIGDLSFRAELEVCSKRRAWEVEEGGLGPGHLCRR